MTLNPPIASDLTRRTALYVVLGAASVTVAGLAAMHLAAFSTGFLAGALVPYCAVCFIAVARIATSHPFDRFGIANTLTLIRLVVCSLIGGLAFELAIREVVPSASMGWSFLALATGAMIIDGLDGYFARKHNMTSDFGGRFDMEVDALQILLLCIVALALGKAGLWVLIGGALRYVYEVVGVFWPVLRRPLPPSFRRKLISVVQGGALVALLAPVIVPPLSTVIAAAALLLLIYSFAVDVIWLALDDARARKAAS